MKADGKAVEGRIVEREAHAAAPPTTRPEMPSLTFRLEYPLASPPDVVRINQSLLREYENWTADCVVRVRQSTDPTFQTGLLTRERAVEFGCDWSGGAATRPAVKAWVTVRLARSLSLVLQRSKRVELRGASGRRDRRQ